MESKKYNKVVSITKKEQIHRYRKQVSGYQWGKAKKEGKYRGRRVRGLDYYA